MVERATGKSKSDMALQAQSTKERKGKESWNGNKGRGSYNNSTGRNQQEGNWLNQRKPWNQGNQRGDGEKPDKSQI
jgi:hypothetical protein